MNKVEDKLLVEKCVIDSMLINSIKFLNTGYEHDFRKLQAPLIFHDKSGHGLCVLL